MGVKGPREPLAGIRFGGESEFAEEVCWVRHSRSLQYYNNHRDLQIEYKVGTGMGLSVPGYVGLCTAPLFADDNFVEMSSLNKRPWPSLLLIILHLNSTNFSSS